MDASKKKYHSNLDESISEMENQTYRGYPKWRIDQYQTQKRII